MLRSLLYSVIFLMVMLVTSGCDANASGASGVNADSGEQSPGSSAAANSSSLQPGQVEPPPGQPAAGSVETGSAEAPLQGAASSSPPAEQPTIWLSYTSDKLKFSIDYPDVYIVADQGSLPQDVPNLVQRVRFQDKALASSPTANLQPPQFLIDVFENQASLGLEDWIAANERRAKPAKTGIGNTSGYVVSLQTLQAPNQFYFASHGQYIYRLVPLGQHSEDMLRSFKLG